MLVNLSILDRSQCKMAPWHLYPFGPHPSISHRRGSSWSDWKRWIRWLPKCYAAWIRRLAADVATVFWAEKSTPPAGSETSRGWSFAGAWWHLSSFSTPTKSLFSIWLVCTAFNWCNDVLPTILLEQKTPPLICSGSLNESCTAYVHFQVLRTSFLLSSFHLLSSIDLHKT